MFLSFSLAIVFLAIFLLVKVVSVVWNFDRIVQEDFAFYCVLLTIENQKHKLRDNGGELSIIVFLPTDKKFSSWVHPVLSIT